MVFGSAAAEAARPR